MSDVEKAEYMDIVQIGIGDDLPWRGESELFLEVKP